MAMLSDWQHTDSLDLKLKKRHYKRINCSKLARKHLCFLAVPLLVGV